MDCNACVLVAQNDPFFFDNCKNFFAQYNVFTAQTENCYDDVLNAIRLWRPDVVLLDAFVPPLDSIAVIEAIQFLPELKGAHPLFFVLSCINDSQLKTNNLAAGAFEYLLKPIDNYMVLSRVFNAILSLEHNKSGINAISSVYLAKNSSCAPNDLLCTIEQTLLELGISTALNGYEYLCKAILYYTLAPSTQTSLTKHIYPITAKAFCSSPTCVERSIRYAITSAWQGSTNKKMTRYFNNKKPTNMKFIVAISNHLSLTWRESEVWLQQ